jgi:transposase-like protein
LAEPPPTAAAPRGWTHTILNVLDAIPKKYHAEATTVLKDMPYAETQAECERLRDQFSRRSQRLAPPALAR